MKLFFEDRNADFSSLDEKYKNIFPALEKIENIFESIGCKINFNIDRRNNLQVSYRIYSSNDNRFNRGDLYSFFSIQLNENYQNPDNLYEKLSDVLKKDIDRELKELISGFSENSNIIMNKL